MILQLLDVVIGLATIFLIFSTVASSLADLIESLAKARGRLLERGVAGIFARIITGDGRLAPVDAPQKLVAAFYNSPHIYSLFRDDYRAQGGNLPSYIPAERFAGAVLALAESGDLQKDFAAVRDTVLKLSGIDLAALDPGRWRGTMHDELVRYFDTCMDRVSGWYARLVRWRLFAIGLVLALVFNIDSLGLVQQLSEDDSLRRSLVAQALLDHGSDGSAMAAAATTEDEVQRTQDQINRELALVQSLGLPIGWTRNEWQRVAATTPDASGVAPVWSPLRMLGSGALWAKLAGLLATACAISFGSPFWFDLLNQLVRLRTSIKPEPAKAGDEDKADDVTRAAAAPKAAPAKPD